MTQKTPSEAVGLSQVLCVFTVRNLMDVGLDLTTCQGLFLYSTAFDTLKWVCMCVRERERERV